MEIMDTIPCPKCGKQIQITEALRHQLEEKIKVAQKEKHKEELERVKVLITAQTEKRLKEQSQKELEKSEKEKELLEKKLAKKEDASRNAQEEQRLKLKEKDLQLDEIRRVNEDLKRKLEQGSQQRQGEVLELDLEEKLHLQFPNDEFLPIPKGVEGGDIWQKVIYQEKL